MDTFVGALGVIVAVYLMLRSEHKELRGEIEKSKTELKGEIGSLRTELKSDIAELRTEVRHDLREVNRRIDHTNDLLVLHIQQGHPPHHAA